MKKFNIIIIGGGPGGYVAGIRGSQLGGKVCIIEKDEIGGTCLNRGCIPTKVLVASAEYLRKARHSGNFGIEINGTIEPSLSSIMNRKKRVIETNIKGIKALFKKNNITLIYGEGKLVSNKRVYIKKRDGSEEEIEGDNIIIATGSKPLNIPLFPFDSKTILSSDDILNIETIPESLLIIGAGVIGCEYGFIFNELGTKVTMVEMMPHALPLEDEEISESMEREIKKNRIKLYKNNKVESISRMESGGVCSVLSNGEKIEAEKILVSIGRTFNVEGLNLKDIEVEQGPKGEIIVNNKMQTSIPNIYAIGDVTGKVMLAHVASTQGIISVENALGGNVEMDYTVIPATIFTNPEIGRVGLTEKDAKDKGIEVKIGRFPFRGLGKSQITGDFSGLVKIICRADSSVVLGMHIIGANATELIHEGALALKMKATYHDISSLIHSHPTFSEAIMEASHDVDGMAIHKI
jgi:dihydrolipoamide dehydrogenase